MNKKHYEIYRSFLFNNTGIRNGFQIKNEQRIVKDFINEIQGMIKRV